MNIQIWCLLLMLIQAITLEDTSLDPSSHANTNEITTTNISLDMTVDFLSKQMINCISILSMRSLKNGISQVILDSYHLNIT